MAGRAGLDSLRARVRAIEDGGVAFGREVARLGPPLDEALPWGGLPYRALHEVGGLAATSAVAGLVPPGQALVMDLTLVSAVAPRPGEAPPPNPFSLWGNAYTQGAAITIRP